MQGTTDAAARVMVMAGLDALGQVPTDRHHTLLRSQAPGRKYDPSIQIGVSRDLHERVHQHRVSLPTTPTGLRAVWD